MLIIGFVVIFAFLHLYFTGNAPAAEPSCAYHASAKTGDFDIQLIVSGRHQERVIVELYRADPPQPLPLYERYRHKFPDTGQPYILQAYDEYGSSRWSAGAWVISWELNGRGHDRPLELAEAIHSIHLMCD